MLARLLRKSVDVVPWKLRMQIKRLPIIAPLQRWAIQRFLSDGEFLHTVNAGPARGLRYWVRLPEDKGVWTGTYENTFAEALAEAVSAGDVCLDIGGYRGFFAGVLALAGAREVHICEPLPGNIQRIRRLIDANLALPLKLHGLAVGEHSGSGEFFVMPEASMGKLSNSQFQEQHSGKETIQVRIETLDRLVASGAMPAPNVIKIDVEGAEAMVLKGSDNVLRDRKPKIFIEVHSRPLARECNELLARCGYSIRVLETGRPPDFVSEPEVCHFVATQN